ncbi:DEAD/DEAH box helicase [Flavobacterium chuncheonense]|uniref:DEAD/DEAH box helicase n=1 Tax=Flavobacterium chuncheonense TaxID=2026653 RepID=A0ABW5YL03_9FLAO
MDINKLIDKIDEGCLQDILGESLTIITGLSDQTITIPKLKAALLNVYGYEGILTEPTVFKKIVPKIAKEDAIILCEFLSLKFVKDHPWQALEDLKFNDLVKSRLCQFFGLEYKPITKESVEPFKDVSPAYPSFLHQIIALNKVKEILFVNNKTKVLLHMPTGSGKTRTSMNLICEYLRNNLDKKVIWFANTEELCRQASDEFDKAWSKLGNRQIQKQNIWGGNQFDPAIKNCFIIFSLQSFINLYSIKSEIATKLSGECGLVIMDEAHMSIAPKYKLAIDILLFKDAKLLGLSATPGRTWNNPEEDLLLSNYFEKQKVTLMVEGYDNPVDYLIQEGYLAKTINSSLLYDGGIAPTQNDLNFLKDELQLSKTFLDRLSVDSARNILICSKIKSLINKHNRIIVFAMNVKHSNVLALTLSAFDIEVYSISSETDNQVRKNAISRFKSDEDKPIILCNYGVLTTGFDAPKTSCAVITRPTDSLVLYSQMVGRVIRGPKAGGNEEAEIVTVVDTKLPGFDKVSEAFFNWEDVW